MVSALIFFLKKYMTECREINKKSVKTKKGFDIMKKLRLKKWVKILIVVIALISIIFILTHLLFENNSDFIKYAKMCDQDKGYTCSYYEIREYMIRGGK